MLVYVVGLIVVQILFFAILWSFKVKQTSVDELQNERIHAKWIIAAWQRLYPAPFSELT